MDRELEYRIIDAFTKDPLEGNPVAVFLNASGLSSIKMQRIAQELHLSETTFLFPSDETDTVKIRIFTPVNELPFAGHPTLGAAPVAAHLLGKNNFSLETARAVLSVAVESHGHRRWSIWMTQPSPVEVGCDWVGDALAALGAAPDNNLPVALWDNGPRHLIVPLPSVGALDSLSPDHRALSQWSNVAFNAVAQADDGHWELRMFSPAYGVVEDAATGSAAGCLATHLVSSGAVPEDTEVEIRQGKALGRLSVMRASARRRASKWQVRVRGEAVEVGRGILHATPKLG